MIFTKKINLKLAIIGITFMGLLIITNSVLMEFGLQKSVEFTYSTHYEETEKILNNKFELLKDLADTLAEDKKIINILDDNRSIEELDETRIKDSFKEMTEFEKYFKEFIFIKEELQTSHIIPLTDPLNQLLFLNTELSIFTKDLS